MVETPFSKRRAISTKVFILFLSKITPLSLVDITISFVAILIFALLQVLGHSHIFDKVVELDMG